MQSEAPVGTSEGGVVFRGKDDIAPGVRPAKTSSTPLYRSEPVAIVENDTSGRGARGRRCAEV